MDGELSVSAPAGYQAALDYLFARTTGDTKLGLERTNELLRLMGDPHRGLKVFHIAGTNGKGSVAASLEAMLRWRGLRVGTYTSPHIVDFRERIRVDGEMISENEVLEFIARWTSDAERIGATFFEVTTALAFEWFARREVDVAVVETGLGGRLDATNVVTPVVAAVTSISLDHTDVLGETIVQIAMEKAGIFKRGLAAVVGERKPSVARELANLAEAMGATPIVQVGEEYDVTEIGVGPEGTTFRLTAEGRSATVHTRLIGEHQAWNAVTAIAMLRAAGPDYVVPLDSCTHALGAVALPGRLDRRGKFIFDVAHNPDGMATVAKTVSAMHPTRPVAALVGVLADKDWRAMIDRLAPLCDYLILTTPPSAPANRRWDSAAAAAYAVARGVKAVSIPDFSRAIAIADQSGLTVLVTGSFHTVGDVMSCLQLSPMAA